MDNWFHVRKFLMGMKFLLKTDADTLIDRAEQDLIAILSMCEIAHDPMPWLLVLDYALRKLWKSILERVKTIKERRFLYLFRVPEKSKSTAFARSSVLSSDVFLSSRTGS